MRALIFEVLINYYTVIPELISGSPVVPDTEHKPVTISSTICQEML